MGKLRVLGDVHAQVDFSLRRGASTYLELIATCDHSLQLGDMGDGETYAELIEHVDARMHRFFPGNHDHYNVLPPHCLGDFGVATLGGVEFFFARGAESSDKQKLQQTGRKLGRQLWFEEEQLTDEQMAAARREFEQTRPTIVISHDAPSRIARFLVQEMFGADSRFAGSRTSGFLQSLWETHQPRLWLFGHYHRDWDYKEAGTQFRCVGELSSVDIDEQGVILQPSTD